MNSNSKLSYAIAAILSGSSIGIVHSRSGHSDRHQRVGRNSRDHRHRPTAYGKSAGRADHDSSADSGNPAAAKRHDAGRLHQVHTERHPSQRGARPKQHLHARSVPWAVAPIKAAARLARYRTSPCTSTTNPPRCRAVISMSTRRIWNASKCSEGTTGDLVRLGSRSRRTALHYE